MKDTFLDKTLLSSVLSQPFCFNGLLSLIFVEKLKDFLDAEESLFRLLSSLLPSLTISNVQHGAAAIGHQKAAVNCATCIKKYKNKGRT